MPPPTLVDCGEDHCHGPAGKCLSTEEGTGYVYFLAMDLVSCTKDAAEKADDGPLAFEI